MNIKKCFRKLFVLLMILFHSNFNFAMENKQEIENVTKSYTSKIESKSFSEDVTKWVKRNKTLVKIFTAVGIIGTVGLTLAGWNYFKKNDDKTQKNNLNLKTPSVLIRAEILNDDGSKKTLSTLIPIENTGYKSARLETSMFDLDEVKSNSIENNAKFKNKSLIKHSSYAETEMMPAWRNTRTYKFDNAKYSVSFKSENDYNKINILEVKIIN